MIPTTSCPEADHLADLFRGRLSFVVVERLSDHLERCPTCSLAAGFLREDDPLAGVLRARTSIVDVESPAIVQLIETLSTDRTNECYKANSGHSVFLM